VRSSAVAKSRSLRLSRSAAVSCFVQPSAEALSRSVLKIGAAFG
jgi:hypothetical protein